MKKNRFILPSLIIMLMVSLLIGCDSLSGSSSNSTLTTMGIANASNLFIAPSSSSRNARSASNENALFMITEDGYIQEVTYFDEYGSEIIMSYTPSNLYNVNTDFVIVEFNTFNGYLVRKSDGAVFLLDGIGTPTNNAQSWNFINAKKVQTDDNGNIYFETELIDSSNYRRKVIKIDITDPNQLSKSDYTPDIDNVSAFELTSEGHLAYSYGSDSNNNRVKKSNGGLYNLPDFVSYWIGLDGKIKYQKSDYEPSTVVTVTIDSNDFSVSTSEITGDLHYFQSVQNSLIKFDDRVIAVSTGNEYIQELENPSNSPRKITLSEIDDIDLVCASSDFYYLSGKDGNNPLLLKVDPSDDSVEILLAEGLYDIITMSVSSDNKVLFNALRMSDGVKIIGEIDSKGKVTVLDETLNTEIVILERIN